MLEPRLNYEDSCRRLQGRYLKEGVFPPIPNRVPQYTDEEPLGVSFFRTLVGAEPDLSNLTLPRTFFGRSEVNSTSFRNTDLAGSNLCWNDFINVDFTEAILPNSDLRASVFQHVKFVRADLRGSDMRRSSYEECDFEGALMERVVLTKAQGTKMELSDQQRLEISWTEEDGPEPDGG